MCMYVHASAADIIQKRTKNIKSARIPNPASKIFTR